MPVLYPLLRVGTNLAATENGGCLLVYQGTYCFWKSGKIARHFSSQGKVREFGIFFKNQGILMT